MTTELGNQLRTFAARPICTAAIRRRFIELAQNDHLTRDEGPLIHVGLFIMAIDSKAQKVYIGHHKKSDRWIPHGGHVDMGETVEQTLEREIREEWGMEMKASAIGEPVLLTITSIENPKQWHVCREHLDVWFFVDVDSQAFTIKEEILCDEFHEARWVDLVEARQLVGDTVTVIEALELVENSYFGVK